jgi:DNA-binding GntR family transcriptional regulator
MHKNTLLNPRIVERAKEMLRRSDLAYDAIRESIASGRIKPGEWLRQEVLAQELAISQPTIREALSRLVAEGLAVQVPYKGVKSISLPREDLEDVFETRAALQGLAMERASRCITSKNLARMRELLPHTVMSSDPNSADKAWEANREFHWIAIRASRRRHLIRLLGQLWDLTNPYLLICRGTEVEQTEASQMELLDHTQILEALEARDGKKARKLTERHLLRTLKKLKTLIPE